MTFQFSRTLEVFTAKDASRLTVDERPDRQRGLTSFLTWSFFLANFLTGIDAASGGARANTADDLATRNGNGHDVSFSPLSQKPLQPLALEGTPPPAPIPAGSNPTDFAIVAPLNIEPIKLSLAQSLEGQSPSAQIGSIGGSHSSSTLNLFNTTNNYYQADSHDVTTTNINNLFLFDSHDITTNITVTIQQVVGAVGNTVTPVLETVADVIGALPPLVDEVVSPVVEVVDSTLDTAGQTVSELLTGTTGLVGDVTDTTFDVVETLVDTSTNLVADTLPVVGSVVDDVANVADVVLHTTEQTVSTLFETVPAVVTDLADTTFDVVETLVDTSTNLVADTLPVVGSVVDDVANVADVVLDTTEQAVTTIVGETVSQTVASVIDTASDVVGSLIDTATDVVADTLPMVDDIASIADNGGAGQGGDVMSILSATDVLDTDVVSDTSDALLNSADMLTVPTAPILSALVAPLASLAFSDIGLSSTGSLSFEAGPAESSTEIYSQYNISVQDAAISADADVTTQTSPDPGAITTIISSAIGLLPTLDHDTPAHAETADAPNVHLGLDLHTHHLSGLFG